MPVTLLFLAATALFEPTSGPTFEPSRSTPAANSVYDAAMIAKASPIPVPAGYGRYCSLSYASGGWAFDWGSASDDPCATMLASSPGGTIARAGLYSIAGKNNIVVRCGGKVMLYKLAGAAGMKTASEENRSEKKCVFTVAPKSLPILHAPFPIGEDSVTNVNYFNFARGYTVLTNSGVQSSKVDYKGNASASNHDGFDWPMAKGVFVNAVHKGVVLEARGRDVEHHCPESASRYQNEAYVLHVVGTGVYAELFVSYYAHLHGFLVKTGDTVVRGQALGIVGTTGCSSGTHLHFELNRMSNTAAKYRRSLKVPATEDYDTTTPIDPYGFSWSAKAGFDPWAWRGFAQGNGALTIAMWAEGQAPVRH